MRAVLSHPPDLAISDISRNIRELTFSFLLEFHVAAGANSLEPTSFEKFERISQEFRQFPSPNSERVIFNHATPLKLCKKLSEISQNREKSALNQYAFRTAPMRRLTFRDGSGDVLIVQYIRPIMFIPDEITFTTYALYRLP